MHLLNDPKSKFINRKNMMSQKRNSTAAAAAAASKNKKELHQTATKSRTKTKQTSNRLNLHQNQNENRQSFTTTRQREWLIKCLTFSVLVCVACIIPGYDCTPDGDGVQVRSAVYTELTRSVGYESSTEYNARGMQPLYNISHSILNLFVSSKPLPKGYIKYKDDELTYGPKVENNEWGDLVRQYWGVLLFVVFVLILVCIVPIIGLCFCCCRCMGNCGARSEPFDKKHDTCRRICYGLLLLLLVIGLLFGVIVIFTTNSFIDEGVEGTPATMRSGGRDAQTFLNHTADEIDHLLIKNYDELGEALKDTLNNTAQLIIDNLNRKSHTVSLEKLHHLLNNLPEIKEDLEKMKSLNEKLGILAPQLEDGMRDFKRSLMYLFELCQEPVCVNFTEHYKMDVIDEVAIPLDRVFDVTDIIDELNSLIHNATNTTGHDNLEAMQADLNKSIIALTPKIAKAIDDAGSEFNGISRSIRSELNNASDLVGFSTRKATKVTEAFIIEHSPYRYYLALGACIACLLILVCLVAGLCCGICGKRPGGYGDDCCNKGTGSRCLMTAVALIFLTFSIIALIALLHFLLGVVAYRGFCLLDGEESERMENSEDLSELHRMLYPALDQGRMAGSSPSLRVSDVINSCKDNVTIYEALRLHNRVNVTKITEIPRHFNINKTLEHLKENINVRKMENVEILTDADKRSLLDLKSSSLYKFNLSQFNVNTDKLTRYPLPELGAAMSYVATNAVGTGGSQVKSISNNLALHMATYENHLVKPLQQVMKDLKKCANKIDSQLRYGNMSLDESIDTMIKETERAQEFITGHGPDFVRECARNISLNISDQINDYMNRVVYAIEHRIGKCGPVARVHDAGVMHICNRLIDPLNGFWTGLFWCLFLFLLILCVAIKLARLYQKSDSYPGPLVESEYLYDAYSERDHIPMANGPKNKRRKNKEHRRRGEYYEDSVGPAPHGGGVPAAAGAGMRDTRYNDMAPKHWDGGPPRYQNPPMAPPASEYERPPPYYYPGATEQD